MHQVFQRRFDKIEKIRIAFIASCKSIPENKIYLNHEGTKWSVVQIMRHLIKTEHAAFIVITRKLGQKNSETENLKSLLRGIILQASLLLPLKYKAPKLFDDFPNEGTIEQLAADWERERNTFAEILSSLDEGEFHKIIFNHPAAGWISLKSVFTFIHAHMAHHRRQIRRIKYLH